LLRFQKMGPEMVRSPALSPARSNSSRHVYKRGLLLAREDWLEAFRPILRLAKHWPKADNPVTASAAGLQGTILGGKRLPPKWWKPRLAESRLREKFVYVFPVCAMVKQRGNPERPSPAPVNRPYSELAIAAEEQRKMHAPPLENYSSMSHSPRPSLRIVSAVRPQTFR